MTPDQRIHRNLERICNAAGVSMMHCTEEQLAVMRQIMSESYIKGSNDNYDAVRGKGRK